MHIVIVPVRIIFTAVDHIVTAEVLGEFADDAGYSADVIRMDAFKQAVVEYIDELSAFCFHHPA